MRQRSEPSIYAGRHQHHKIWLPIKCLVATPDPVQLPGIRSATYPVKSRRSHSAHLLPFPAELQGLTTRHMAEQVPVPAPMQLHVLNILLPSLHCGSRCAGICRDLQAQAGCSRFSFTGCKWPLSNVALPRTTLSGNCWAVAQLTRPCLLASR